MVRLFYCSLKIWKKYLRYPDRIAVIYEGQIMGTVQRQDATMELLG